jgi:nitroreductase
MDLDEALQRRRMVRSFDGSAVDEEQLTKLFEESLRAPTAGNARGISWVLGIGSPAVRDYFLASTDATWRSNSARFAGLARASAVALCVMEPDRYVQRYGESDKVSSGLGSDPSAWPLPYWVGDAGAATMAALLLLEAQGLSASFLGAFRNHDEIQDTFALPRAQQIYGAVLIGRPDNGDHRSPSLDRPGPSRSERVVRYRSQA